MLLLTSSDENSLQIYFFKEIRFLLKTTQTVLSFNPPIFRYKEKFSLEKVLLPITCAHCSTSGIAYRQISTEIVEREKNS